VKAGVNLGTQGGKGDWSCMGRCGDACKHTGRWDYWASSWTKDCLAHDACGWYHKSTSLFGDKNCGKAAKAAADDWTEGVAQGCTQTYAKVKWAAGQGTSKISVKCR